MKPWTGFWQGRCIAVPCRKETGAMDGWNHGGCSDLGELALHVRDLAVLVVPVGEAREEGKEGAVIVHADGAAELWAQRAGHTEIGSCIIYIIYLIDL